MVFRLALLGAAGLLSHLAVPAPGIAQGKYAEVNDLRMYYQIHGEGAPLLLLHGGTSTIDGTFSEQLPFFAAHRRIIAVEQMGHGRTADSPSRPFSYQQMADDTAALLRQLGSGRVDIVGHSDGGNVGLQLAIRHPELVRRVAVSGAIVSRTGMDLDAMEWVRTSDPYDWPVESRKRYEELSPDGPEHWPIVLERLKKMWLGFEDWPVEDLQRITAPVLVIGGDHDVPVEHLVEMFRTIPRARLLVLPGTDHETLRGRAGWLNPILQSFFAEVMSEAR